MGSSAVIQGSFPNGLHAILMHSRVPGKPVTHGAQPTAVQLSMRLPIAPMHGGEPLPGGVRQRMEALFGTRFADVRLHTVASQASMIGAAAYTQGSHIHFARGQFAPDTPQGRQILGRELTHIVQQRAGRVRNPFGQGIAVVVDPALEMEAGRMAVRAAMAAPRTRIVQPFVCETGRMRRIANLRGYRPQYTRHRDTSPDSDSHITIEPGDLNHDRARGEYSFDEFHYTENGNLRVGFRHNTVTGTYAIAWRSAAVNNLPADLRQDIEERAWAAAEDFLDDMYN